MNSNKMLHKSNRQLFNLNIKTPKRMLPERALSSFIPLFAILGLVEAEAAPDG